MSLSNTRNRLLAAGLATLSAGAAVLTGTAGTANASTPRSSFSKTLTDVVAPGTLESASWTVPAGDALELTKLTLQSTGGGTVGQARFQRLVAKAQPTNLLEVALGQVGKAFDASFATPLVFRAGQTLVLTTACDTNQAACKVSLGLTGELVAASSLHTSAYFSALEAVVAPGTTSSSSWTVPAKDTMAFTDLLASTDGSGQVGGLSVVLAPAGGRQRTLLRMTLGKLGMSPFDYRLAGAVSAGAGSKLTLTVKCAAGQAACSVAVLFAGRLS
jgi:hypothetical protein